MLRNLTVYKASAGSGKTFRLAYEFIRHQLGYRDDSTGRYRLAPASAHGGNRHRAILAITFTNKATEEMKRRIVRELAVLAGAPLVSHRRSDYAAMLTAEFGCTGRELQSAARQALTDLLYDFNFFNVSTIDAFFQNVLRVFAREAELSGNYEVELNDDYAIETGVDSMLSAVTKEYGAGESLTPQMRQLASWLHRYMIAQIDDGQAFNLFNRTSSLRSRLIGFIKSLTGEDFKYNEQAIREYVDDPARMERFERELMQLRRDTRDSITAGAAKVFTLVSRNGYPENYLERGINSLLRAWASGECRPLTDAQRSRIDADPAKRYYAAIAKAGLIDSEIDSTVVECMRAIDRYDELDTVAAQIYSLGLFGHVLRHINEFRHDNNLILLSDTNNLLREIIGDNATPFVYERVGLWLRHFLIDEFQDTSSLQWDNLRPLVETSLAEANDNLIIGDEKQCIYRFRNSDPSLLRSKVEEQFPGRVRLEGNTAESNTNYRSSREVIEFNNTLFTRMATDLGIGDLYRNVVQKAGPGAPSGYVFMQGVKGADGTKASFVEASLAMTAREIARQLSSGYSQSDIAILVRSNSEADTVIDYLLSQAKEIPGLEGLQVLSDDALTIQSCSAVRLIVNDLKRMDTMLTASVSGRYTTNADYHSIVREFDSLRNGGLSASDALSTAVSRYMAHDTATVGTTPSHHDTATSLYSLGRASHSRAIRRSTPARQCVPVGIPGSGARLLVARTGRHIFIPAVVGKHRPQGMHSIGSGARRHTRNDHPQVQRTGIPVRAHTACRRAAHVRRPAAVVSGRRPHRILRRHRAAAAASAHIPGTGPHIVCRHLCRSAARQPHRRAQCAVRGIHPCRQRTDRILPSGSETVRQPPCRLSSRHGRRHRSVRPDMRQGYADGQSGYSRQIHTARRACASRHRRLHSRRARRTATAHRNRQPVGIRRPALQRQHPPHGSGLGTPAQRHTRSRPTHGSTRPHTPRPARHRHSIAYAGHRRRARKAMVRRLRLHRQRTHHP